MKRLNKNNIFQSNEISRNLAQKSFRGGMSTIASQGIQFFISTVATVVLARLLTPSEYGLVGMAMVIVAFARMFMEAGLSTATVQRDRITHEQISTLFWINLFIGLFLGLCVLASSPLVARFYERAELTAIIAALSLTFFINGIVIQHEALLRRHMRFGTLAVISIAAEAMTLCVTLILALFGWRYWAIVGGIITTAFARSLGIFLFCRWIPGRMRKGTGVRDMINFGRNLTVTNFFIYFSLNLDNILIGKFIGANALGIYGRAYRLFMMPVTQIRMPVTNVAITSLSALKEQPNRYIKYYQRLLDLMATVTIPLTIYCVIEADFIIRMLLGLQWLEVIPVFRILAIAGIIQPVAQTLGIVLLTFGFSDRYLYFGMATTIIQVIAIVAGLSFGIKGVAAGYVVANYVIFIPSLFYCFHKTPVSVALFLKTLIPPLLTSGLAAGIVILIKILNHNDSTAFHFMLLGVFLLIYAGVSCLRKSIRETIVMFLANLSVTSRSKEVERVDKILVKGAGM